MNTWHQLTLSAIFLATSAGALGSPAQALQDKQEKIKWIFMFSAPKAEIIKTGPDHYRLVINDPNKTHVFMLNDRPFYLIREIQDAGENLWKNFTKTNYAPNRKRAATLIINGEAQEVFLNHYKLAHNKPQFDIESTSTTESLHPSKGAMTLFVTTSSKPLCNLINQMRHNSSSLSQLPKTS